MLFSKYISKKLCKIIIIAPSSVTILIGLIIFAYPTKITWKFNFIMLKTFFSQASTSLSEDVLISRQFIYLKIVHLKKLLTQAFFRLLVTFSSLFGSIRTPPSKNCRKFRTRYATDCVIFFLLVIQNCNCFHTQRVSKFRFIKLFFQNLILQILIHKIKIFNDVCKFT